MATKYPEHDKLRAVKDRSQSIGEFLDWLTHEKNATLAVRHSHTDSCFLGEDGLVSRYAQCEFRRDELIPLGGSITDLLSEFFEIDQENLEREKRSMLAELRGEQAQETGSAP